MNIFYRNILFLMFLFLAGTVSVFAQEIHQNIAPDGKELNVTEIILEHVGDSYSWHIATVGSKEIAIPLPVILRGNDGVWHFFSSSRFEHGHARYKGFSIATDGKYKGKIVEKNTANEEVRPFDFSLTKNAVSLLMSSILLIILVLSCARWYKRHKVEDFAPKGFVGAVELLITTLVDDLIKPCAGKNYARYTPYLLTAFFFIFINNLLGLIPIFPGGANVTGNIAITSILAIFTFVIVNVFGTKEYWKEIFWPDVPTWLKFPIPLIPAIEIVGMFTKPFALMIRLFANILAGHAIVLGLTCMIFLTVSMGTVMNTGMSILSVIMTVFINIVELLVAFIQAYVFTMLSAVFIGLSQVESHHANK